MIQSRLILAGAAMTLAVGFHPVAASAQQSEWFVPNQQRPSATVPRPAAPRAPAPSAAPGGGMPAPALMPDGNDDQAAPPQQQVQVQLPPAPEIPTLPKGAATPAAIIGILSVPDVLRISTAYQQGDKELGARRQKLNEDAQKEQVALRDLGQALGSDRAKMSPEQIRNKERELQDRIAESRRKFGERNRIIQEAGQYVMAQIDRTLEQVAQVVAASRGVNLVLNRAQILGTTADFDLTPQVAEVLNKVLPSVVIPPDGVSPVTMAAPQASTGGSSISVPNATPASAPLTPAPTAATQAPASPPAKPPAAPAQKR
ncbi:MAG: OmpH family outer membrane protein [Acetobacteraceae bacterium]|nr:OmpH family outer membrane protein [Acetobacteraceae bacterium]